LKLKISFQTPFTVTRRFFWYLYNFTWTIWWNQLWFFNFWWWEHKNFKLHIRNMTNHNSQFKHILFQLSFGHSKETLVVYINSSKLHKRNTKYMFV
jgi:hypothetical protein